MTGTVSIFFHYYGNWTATATAPYRSLVNYFLNHLDTTTWFNIATNYFDENNYVTGPIGVSLTYSHDQYSMGTTISQTDAENSLRKYLGSPLPISSNAIYIILASPDVESSDGWCTDWCGLHSNFINSNGVAIKYVYTIDPTFQCAYGCSVLPYPLSPNGIFGADSIVSTLAHEVVESLTDPLLNAWINDDGMENGDMCAWTYGNYWLALGFTALEGVVVNINVGTKSFLIQQMFSIIQNECSMGEAVDHLGLATGISSPATTTTTTGTSKAPEVPDPSRNTTLIVTNTDSPGTNAINATAPPIEVSTTDFRGRFRPVKTDTRPKFTFSWFQGF
jgi:hypothetical protein